MLLPRRLLLLRRRLRLLLLLMLMLVLMLVLLQLLRCRRQGRWWCCQGDHQGVIQSCQGCQAAKAAAT